MVAGILQVFYDICCIVGLGVMAPFGLENNVIPDVQIRASSNRDSSHTAKEGRLYNTKSWCAGGNGTDEYLQVDLGKTVTITGLATQADPRGTGWVKSYSIGYSNDGKEWRKIQTDLVINVSLFYVTIVSVIFSSLYF